MNKLTILIKTKPVNIVIHKEYLISLPPIYVRTAKHHARGAKPYCPNPHIVHRFIDK